jgi:DNA-binding HxlR family transcriptional regulator
MEAHHPFSPHAWAQAFGELGRLIPGITQRMLTLQLRELEDAGIVLRTVYAQVPPRVDYALTPLGHSLQPVLVALRDWGNSYARSQGQESDVSADGHTDVEQKCR